MTHALVLAIVLAACGGAATFPSTRAPAPPTPPSEGHDLAMSPAATRASSERAILRALIDAAPNARDVAQLWVRLGENAFEQHQLADALDAYAHVVPPSPFAAYAAYKRAWTYVNLAAPASAAAAFEQALAIPGELPRDRLLRGSICRDWPRAIGAAAAQPIACAAIR